MIRKIVRMAWDILPNGLLRRAIRITQDKFTVSAAAVILNENGEVLILNHALRFYCGWGLPGGFLERGEQPEDGIRREIREETGIEMECLRLIRTRVIDGHVEVIFAAKAVGEPEVLSREILELGWFYFETLPEKMNLAQKMLIGKVLSGEV